VDLVKVDGVDTQPHQAVVRFTQDRVPLQGVLYAPAGSGYQRGLGKHIRGPIQTLDGAAYDLFRVTETVSRGSVNPVHAKFEGTLDRFD
jgi:hypothetical protein